jgi:hypothetical protein
MQSRLLTDPEWGLDGGNITNLGLHPEDVERLKTPMWIPEDMADIHKKDEIRTVGTAKDQMSRNHRVLFEAAPLKGANLILIKTGMMVPVRFWMQGEMRRYAKRLLSKKNLARVEFFNADYVRMILDYDRSDIWGNRHGLKLWMLVTFMLWHEQMVEGAVRPVIFQLVCATGRIRGDGV